MAISGEALEDLSGQNQKLLVVYFHSITIRGGSDGIPVVSRGVFWALQLESSLCKQKSYVNVHPRFCASAE